MPHRFSLRQRRGSRNSGDILDTTTLAARLFTDVQTNFSGQIIILENENPPNALGVGSRDISFTKNADRGRYGLFPHNQTSGADPKT